MRQTIDEVIQKLVIEKQDLTSKIVALEGFLTCPDFMETTPAQKKLLEDQHAAMIQYKNVLIRRIVNLRVEKVEALEHMAMQEPEATEPEQPAPVYAMYGKECEKCSSYLNNGFCTGSKKNGERDHTGAMLCFTRKNAEE